MIAEIIRQLQSGKWYGCSDTIEIAKGKHAIPKTWEQAKEKIRRVKYTQQRVYKRQNKNILKWLLGKR